MTINRDIGFSFPILNYQLKMLQVINPLDFLGCMYFRLSCNEPKRIMVSEDDRFPAKNVVSPFLESYTMAYISFSYVEYLMTVSLKVSK